MADEKTTPNDADIRWGVPNPCADQRATEAKVAAMFCRCAGLPPTVAGSVFVEGLELDVPCRTEAEFRVAADVTFGACREWTAAFNARHVPHSLFVLGCGPDESAAFRIVAFDLAALLRAVRGLGRELGARHVLVVHSTIQALGPDGTDALGAAARLLVRQVMAAGGDHETLPWGYVQRVVGRAWDGQTGEERPWAWMQAIGGDEVRQEVHPRVFAPYAMISVGEDGATIPNPDATAAEA